MTQWTWSLWLSECMECFHRLKGNEATVASSLLCIFFSLWLLTVVSFKEATSMKVLHKWWKRGEIAHVWTFGLKTWLDFNFGWTMSWSQMLLYHWKQPLLLIYFFPKDELRCVKTCSMVSADIKPCLQRHLFFILYSLFFKKKCYEDSKPASCILCIGHILAEKRKKDTEIPLWQVQRGSESRWETKMAPEVKSQLGAQANVQPSDLKTWSKAAVRMELL